MDNKRDVKTLVTLYEQHPCLYVVKSADYHNRNKRDEALRVICRSYQDLTMTTITPEIVKKKINSLRAQYLEQINKIRQSKASGASANDVYKPTWWLFEEMKFLNNHIVARQGESSLTYPSSSKPTQGTSTIIELLDDGCIICWTRFHRKKQ